MRLDKLGNERDEGGDDGALCGVGQADEEEGHVAEDPQGCLREVWERRNGEASLTHKRNSVLRPTQTETQRDLCDGNSAIKKKKKTSCQIT